MKKKKKEKAGRWSSNNGLSKSKKKTSTRFCAMGERKESDIQHHELPGRVRKKTNGPRYMFHGHKGESTKEPFKGHLKP